MTYVELFCAGLDEFETTISLSAIKDDHFSASGSSNESPRDGISDPIGENGTIGNIILLKFVACILLNFTFTNAVCKSNIVTLFMFILNSNKLC